MCHCEIFFFFGFAQSKGEPMARACIQSQKKKSSFCLFDLGESFNLALSFLYYTTTRYSDQYKLYSTIDMGRINNNGNIVEWLLDTIDNKLSMYNIYCVKCGCVRVCMRIYAMVLFLKVCKPLL